jgi:hypothetical protein
VRQAAIVEDMRGQGVGEIGATLIETDANFPARDLFAKCGFSETAKGLWQLRRSAAPAPAPAHVRIEH